MSHKDKCSAPLCVDQDYFDVVWCAGEEICSRRPMKKVQRTQTRINKEFAKGRFVDISWTGRELEESSL